MSTFTPVSAVTGGALIGLAAVLLMLTTGRIAGVSGFLSRLLPPYEDRQMPVRLAFVFGLLSAPLLYGAASDIPLTFDVTANVPLLIAAGLLVGFGAVLGGGCTSGHGVCGTARLSARSLVATPVFVTTAMTTVFIARHVLGG
jgi:uncharacterized membrane protein YedE/YeeE